MLTVVRKVSEPFDAFRDRAEAGLALASHVARLPDPGARVLAIPRGGVAVAGPVALALHAPLALLFVRKLPIPWSPEAGFGAVALDGSRVLNDALVKEVGLSPEQIDQIARDGVAELRRRAREYVGSDAPPDVRGRRVVLVDDGLASGYTMIAAAQMVRRQHPKELVLAVPVSPHDTLRRAAAYFDAAFCLIEQAHAPFAVASYYETFLDVTDQEVSAELRRVVGSAAAPDQPSAPAYPAPGQPFPITRNL